MAVTDSGPIYASTNSGISWTQTSAPSNNWSSVASSADGTKLVAVASPASFANGTGPYTSTNSGATWTLDGVTNGFAWWSAASSADGTILAAIAGPWLNPDGDAIFISTNSGISWCSNSMPGANAVVCSADGTKMVVTSLWGIYTSTNSGSAWILANSMTLGSAIACSADGAKLVSVEDSLILVSTNSGMTWTQSGAPTTNWTAVASSADGSKLLAMAGGSPSPTDFSLVSGCPIYTSVDAGVTWVSNSLPVVYHNGSVSTSVALSADGSKLLAELNAAPNGGNIWRLQTTPHPMINIASINDGVALSWIVPSTNFILQQSGDLQNWVDMTNQPVLNLTKLQDESYLPPLGSNVFFRLKTP